MKQHNDIMSRVLREGKWKSPVRKVGNRWEPVDGGVRTKAVPNVFFTHEMSDGFPLLTTKKMAWKTLKVELEGFIKGITDKKWFQKRGCKIWSQWSNPIGCPSWFNQEEKKEHQLKDRDLGTIYGYSWRNFNKRYVPKPNNILSEEPTVCGVGVRGNVKDDEMSKKLYQTWAAMLRRCYNYEDKDYLRYGGRGVYVCNRWLVFEFFIEDAKRIPGWEEKLLDWNSSSLDKDFYGQNCYGPNTCRWATSKEQAGIKSTVRPINALSPENGTYYHNSILECAEYHNLDCTSISHCLSGKQQNHKGWQFWRDPIFSNEEKPVDQFKNIVETLRTNPMDRRMVCNSWNPNQIHMMALPPCHYSWSCTVIENKINLIFHMRSTDLFLGAPLNIASYALLLCLLAKDSGLEPGNLSATFADCHIYENQIEVAEEQVKREPRDLPTLVLENNVQNLFNKDEFDIFNWDHTNAKVVGYDPHPPLAKVKIVV